MLKLKKLQILGFKSFCDRTELKFHGEGIAAIIGPNGCGKSNIADAISWVLGEQSAKTLRGSRMEDVIFAGTRDRNPTGMAEVSLTLIDPEIYHGADTNAPTEIEIQDDLAEENWDEAELRAHAAAETEQAVEEAQPGKTEGVEASGTAPTTVAEGVSTEAQTSELTPESAPEGTAVVAGIQIVQPQVVLKIRRRKFNQQPAHQGEIAVTRRLFRSGDSEYLLNGKLCRLRDIQELFMGTGLGPESYALIEQGRIGQILSSRPTDRRNIIEEAAGITKFKTKKRLAEARLEEAKQNLNRVNDIFEEVTRQMNSLKRQASKAERYGRLRDEMRAKLRVVLASKFTVMGEESVSLDSQIQQLGGEIHALTEGVQQSEIEHSERTQRGYAIETETRQNRDRLSQIAIEGDRGKARIRTNEERSAELFVRMTSAEAELAQASNRLAALEEERNEHQRLLDSAAADLSVAQQELALSQQEAASAAAELSALEHNRKPVAPRSFRPSAKPPTSATSSLSSRNASRAWIAKSSACAQRIPPRPLRLRHSADSAANSHWNSRPCRNEPRHWRKSLPICARPSRTNARRRRKPRDISIPFARNTPPRSARRGRSRRSSPNTVTPLSRCGVCSSPAPCKVDTPRPACSPISLKLIRVTRMSSKTSCAMN